MIAALQPISGFLNLAPVAPVLPRGRASEQLVPFVGFAIADASTLVNVGTTPSVPLTYTANGTFTTTLKLVPESASADGARHVTLGVSLNLDITVRNNAASANVALADTRANVLRTLTGALTTDMLLAALGGGGTSAAGTLDLLSRFLGADLSTASITAPTTGNATTTSVFSDIFANGALTALPASAISPTANLLTVALPTNDQAGITTTAITGTATFGTLGAGTATAATNAGAAPAAASVALTAAPATAPAAANATAAASAALQQFLTDAVAQARDTVTNNPNYAMAAAALYLSTAVFRSQAADVTAAGLGRNEPVGLVTPTPNVAALPTSVT